LTSKTTERFWKSYKLLPVEIKKKAKKAFKLFQIEPTHPSLHFKRIYSTKSVFSIRISRSYRALGVVQNQELIWFWIGSHSDYDKLISTIKEKYN
jgi:hypothetical protein